MDHANPVQLKPSAHLLIPEGTTKENAKPTTGMHFVWEEGYYPRPATGRTTLFPSTLEKVLQLWFSPLMIRQKGHTETQTKFSKTLTDFPQASR